MKFQDLIKILETQNNSRVERIYWDEDGYKTIPKQENWYKDDKFTLHRLDGPALTTWSINGEKEYEAWVKEGKYHRLDGPARKNWGINDFEMWYINGERYTKEEFDNYVKGLENKEDLEMLNDLGQTFE